MAATSSLWRRITRYPRHSPSASSAPTPGSVTGPGGAADATDATTTAHAPVMASSVGNADNGTGPVVPPAASSDPSVTKASNPSSESSALEDAPVEQSAPAGLPDPTQPTTETETTEKGPANGQVPEDEKPRPTDPGAAPGTKGEEQEDVEDTSQYPAGWALAVLTFGLAMAIFVVALDNTIIATAIPKITTVFDSLDDVGWYGSSYLLTTTSLQPSFGKIYANFNVKWTYLIALSIFELGSIICAAATSSQMLIVGRAVAGAGASAIFSGGMTIVGFSVPLKKRPIYIALLSSMFGISSVIGPILGGALTDKATWRWCFWINLPFGGIALATVFLFFKNPKRRVNNLSLGQKIQEIDLLGAAFLICGIVCLLLALQWGGTTYAWSDSKVWGCIIGAGLIILVFIALQFYRGDRATIPPRIFLRQRSVFWSSWYSCFLVMGIYTHIFYLPFYFQAVKGTTAEGSGIRSIPYLTSITLSSIAIGGSITALGWYVPFMWAGAAVFTVGCGLLYTLQVDSYAGKWIGYQLLAGFGAGASIQIPFVAVQTVLSSTDMPSGNAIAIFFNTLGGAISISVAQNVFSNTLTQEIPKHTVGVDAGKIISAGATHVREITAASQLNGVLIAYDIAIQKAFILPIAVGGIALICSFFMEWKSVKGKKILPPGA